MAIRDVLSPRVNGASQYAKGIATTGGKAMIFTCALLTALSLIPGVQFPAFLLPIVTGIGVEAFGILMSKLTDNKGDKIAVANEVNSVIKQVGPVSKDDFYFATSQLAASQREASLHSQEILDRLRVVEEMVAQMTRLEIEQKSLGLPLDVAGYQRIQSIFDKTQSLFNMLEGTPLERHGKHHANLLLAYLDGLFGAAPRSNPLNPSEALILAAATMLHNVGLCFPQLSDSRTLQNTYPAARLNDLSGSERLTLLTRHWHELSAEMVLGSVNTPDQYPDLGLTANDPVDLIAAVIRALPRGADLPVPDATFQGKAVRINLLVNLLRLAGDLDIASQVEAPPPGEQADWPSAYQLDYWLRYYMEAVRITQGSIQLFCCVPSDEYVPLITNAFYGFYLKRWMETAAPLLSAGWTVLFLPPQIERPTDALKNRKLPMPGELLAIMRDPQRLAEELGTAREILSDQGQYPPNIHPYYFGAIPDLVEFSWELAGHPDYEFTVTVYDQETGERLWRRTGVKQNQLPYPADAQSLITGRRYRWTVDPMLKGYPAPGTGGVFWLLPESSRAAMVESDARLESDSQGDRLLAAGLLEIAYACYGNASSTLQQAVICAPEIAIPARRALLELYDSLAQELARLGKSRDAKTFMRLAEYQASQVQQALSAQGHS